MTGFSMAARPARLGLLRRTSIRARLVAIALSVGALAALALGIALVGLTSANRASQRSQATFNVFRASRDAYEGWLTDDDQSNMVAALAALNDHRQLALMRTTAAQVTQGYDQAVRNLRALRAHAPTAQIAATAARTLSALSPRAI